MLVAAGRTTAADRHAAPATRHRHTIHAGDRACLADWNAAPNRPVREPTLPPAGPYPLYGLQQASPTGRYQVFVHESHVFGGELTNPPPVCYVYFRFPRGYHGRPAMVSYPEIRPKLGMYGDPSISVGNDTDVSGRIFAQRPDGTLYATGRTRRS
jgi:hypothetical protein